MPILIATRQSWPSHGTRSAGRAVGHWKSSMRASIALLALASLLWPLSTADACDGACNRPYPADSGIINVRDFGAKGDGQHDDTNALTAAIAAAGTNTGPSFWKTRIVYLPSCTYRLSR